MLRATLIASLILTFACDDESAGDEGGRTMVQLPRDASTRPKPPRPDAAEIEVDEDAGVDPDAQEEDPDGAEPEADGRPQMGCAEGETRPCADGCGQETCSDGAWGACDGEAALERCNNADDDCDGRIDESFNELGVGCTVQDGACSSQGVHVCNEDGSGVVCQAPPVAPEPEVCDGLDNDCDDNVDEGFDGQLCCTENIHCPPGAMCVDGMCEGGGPGPGPGPNPVDQCQATQEMPSFGVYQNDLMNGSPAHFSPTCDGLFGREVVYTFELEEASRVRIDTRGSLADTIVYVRTTCADPASELACNDDAPGAGFFETHSVLEFNAQANTRYFVFIDSLGFDFLGSSVVVSFSAVADIPDPPDPPEPGVCEDEFDCALDEVCEDGRCVAQAEMPDCMGDDDCPGDQVCEAGECRQPPPPPAAPVCEAPQALEGFGTYRSDTRDRPDEMGASCQANATGGEVAFQIQRDIATLILVDTTNSDFDTVVSVRTDCGDPASEVACDDDTGERGAGALVFTADPGVNYTVLVDGFDGESGAVELLYDGREYSYCVGDWCFFEPAGSCGVDDRLDMGRAMGNSADFPNRLNPPARCGESRSPDAIFPFVFEEETDVVVSTAGSSFDTVLYILDNECGPVVECNDDAAAEDLTSRVRFRAEARKLYFAVVDGFRDASGEFVLTVAPE